MLRLKSTRKSSPRPFEAADELNLLLEWPDQRSRPQWAAIFAVSIALHIFLFLVGTRVPSLIGSRHAPSREIILRRIPLYLPRDVMTQRAPNRQKVTKQIDLADLQEAKPRAARRFEPPKQVLARSAGPSRALPQPPAVSVNQSAPGPALQAAMPAPAPQQATQAAGPFQNIDAAPPTNPHPKLAPPKATVEAAINGLAQTPNSRQLSISDDGPDESVPGSPGSMGQAPAQHAAVELQSDPGGADFRAYLRTILTIVRANWRRVVPESARMGMLRGRTVVEFSIDRSGTIPKLVMSDSSGSEPLDRAAIAGMSMSNPLPPLPADFKGFQVRLAFTFAYNMPAK